MSILLGVTVVWLASKIGYLIGTKYGSERRFRALKESHNILTQLKKRK